MRTIRSITALVALAAALTPAPAAATEPKVAQTPPAVPQTSTATGVPQAERSRPNPVKADARSIEHGRILFSSQCTMCHGAKGDGKGDLVPRLGLEVPDFTNPKQQGRRTDGELFYIVTRGHGQMPGEGDRLTPQHKWDLVNYIRTLAPAPKAEP